MTPPTLDEVLGEIRQLPSLPALVTQIIKSLDNDSVGVDELAAGIAGDQALVARALRVANSPFYGVQSKVSSVHDAIVVLGFRAVGSLVMAASVTSYFTPQAASGFDLYRFWRHCIATALASRALAKAAGLNPESGFTAGLLHDIGRLLLVTTRPEHYALILARRGELDCLIHEAERQVLGFDHAQAGAALATRWRFPPNIIRAVAGHHAAEPGATASLGDAVHVANVLAHALDLGGDADNQVPPLDPGAWQRLGLDAPALKALLAEVEQEHESYCALLAA